MWDLTWNWHSPTDCAQNNSSRSRAQVCQTTSCATSVWNQSRRTRLTRCKQLLKRYSDPAVDFIWFTYEKVFTVEPPFNPGLCASWYQEATHRSQPSRRLCCPLPCHKWLWLNWYLSTWGEGERPVLLRYLAVLADAASNQTCCRTLFIHKTICCLRRNLSFLWFLQDRWGGKWNHFSMTHRLTTDCAKNYCNRTLIVKVSA